MKLSDIKGSKDLLFHLLGITKEGKNKCPFHDDKTPSMAVWLNNGVWFWKCWAGCGSGTVVDAAMKVYNISSPSEAVRVIERENGITIIRDEEYHEPIIDGPRAESFIKFAHDNFINSFDLRDIYTKKRKIENLNTIIKYRLGFIEKEAFKEYGSWKLTGWVIPITNCREEIIAVKIHLERRLRTQPKCLWAPFGTYPDEKKKHGTLTFFPAPESFKDKSSIIICPGELKAMALIDKGFNATSPTTGENKLPDRVLKRLVDCGFDKVFINYDDDPTGRDFKDFMIKALSNFGVLVIPFSYGLVDSIDLFVNKKIDANDVENLKVETESRIEKSEKWLKTPDDELKAIQKEWIFKNLDEFNKIYVETGIVPDEMNEFSKMLSFEEKKEWAGC